MRGTEVQAAGELAGAALSGAAGIVCDVQRGVSRRVFGMLGDIAAPVRLAHDGITGVVHASVRAGTRAVPSGGGRALALTAPPQGRSLADSLGGALALGAINGMWGDRLERDHAPLALGMDLRHGGGEADRIAVFVHGLCETDTSWRLGGRPTYGERLREDLGHTPVYARYNTGRHISDNGRALAAALDALVAGWPVEVSEIVLVGHSMGGLVARSACHYGERDGLGWTERLRHVVCLGSPHMGAPLERAAARGSHLLSRLPETAPLARLLTVRSAGVKDLRYGACLEEDWRDVDPDEWARRPLRGLPVPAQRDLLLRRRDGGARQGQPARADRRRRARAVPERLGRRAAAQARVRVDHGLHLGRVHHLQLLNHPRVYEQMAGWLRRAPALTAG